MRKKCGWIAMLVLLCPWSTAQSGDLTRSIRLAYFSPRKAFAQSTQQTSLEQSNAVLSEPSFTLTQVGPNVWAAISNSKSAAPAGANMGFVIGDDGVVVIDTSVSFDADGKFGTEPAKQLLATIRTLTTLPVRFALRRLVSDAQALRKSGEALADAVMPALGDTYNRWEGFTHLAKPNILDTDAELTGKKRIPQAQPTR